MTKRVLSPVGANRPLGRFLASFKPLSVDDVALQSFRSRPLPPDAVRAMRLFGGVERDSVFQLGNALAARLGRSGEVDLFLRSWAKEEAGHGSVLLQIAAACHHEEQEFETRRRVAPSFAQRSSQARANIAGYAIPHLKALYGVFGAYQEHSVIIAYTLLAARVGDERLTRLLREIVAQERRHFAVYREFAIAELCSSGIARAVARHGMRLLWKPVGFEAMGSGNWTWLFGYLCPTESDRAMLCRSDAILRSLPGLTDLELMGPFLRRRH